MWQPGSFCKSYPQQMALRSSLGRRGLGRAGGRVTRERARAIFFCCIKKCWLESSILQPLLAEQYSTIYYVMMVVKRSWIRTQNTFTPFPLLSVWALPPLCKIQRIQDRTKAAAAGPGRQCGGAPKVYCHCETALQTAAFLVDLSSKCNCRKCFAIF